MNKKIYFAGPSGCGKTTLAKWVSQDKGIPFVETSTKPLWEKHHITTHRELIIKTVNNTQWGYDFQNELLDYREKLAIDNPNFVSDRSPMDNIVYFLLQVAPFVSEEKTQDYIDRAVGLLNAHTTHLFICPYLPLQMKLEDDKMRIANKWYQYTVDNIFMSALLRPDMSFMHGVGNGATLAILSVWDLEKRKDIISSILSGIMLSPNALRNIKSMGNA